MKKKPYVSTSGWLYEEEYVLSKRRTLVRGDKMKIRGESGWFTFLSITTNPKINRSWVDCRDKNGRWRAFEIDRIKGGTPKRRNGVVKHDER